MAAGSPSKSIDPVAKAEVALDPAALRQLQALGLLLRAARTGRGLSRARFGGRLLIGQTTLKRMEAGDPSVSAGYYLAAASALGVEMLSPKLEAAHVLPPKVRRARGRARTKDEWFG